MDKLKSISDIDERIIEKFMIFLRRERLNKQGELLSPTTINRKLISLRSFFDFLIKKKYYNVENPAKLIDLINTTKLSTHTYLTVEQAHKVLEASLRRKMAVRDSLMVKFMLYLGLRVSEVSKLDLTNINLNTHSLLVHGKGNKERFIPLSSDIEQDIIKYLEFRTEHYKSPIDKNALFLSRNKRRICTRRIQEIFRQIADDVALNVGLENEASRKKITCHKLRHTFGTLMVQNGIDILTVKEIMGHESINTTQIYATASNEQIRQAINLQSKILNKDND